ncbi:MAG: molybdopterin molybdotransferase MoeA [Burkholderiales bacterium]|nr:molybdopterin molybdotransferase MoeA [Burkholderiales bacterium]
MTAISRQEALDLLLSRAVQAGISEQVNTEEASGRILSEALVSPIDVPPCDNSAMDGFAIPSGALEFSVSQRIAAGSLPAPLDAGTAARIFTGAPVPQGTEAVVMQEDCEFSDGRVKILKAPKPGANIRRRGEDIAGGSVFLEAGTRLRPQELGMIASVGISGVSVFSKLKVAIFFTGDELVMPGNPLPLGKIYNSNRYSLIGLLDSLGCEIVDLGIVPDSLESTVRALQEGAEKADLVMTCGGVSVGEEDHVKAAVDKIGSIEMWKVNIKPGKPFAFGDLSGIPFLGLPGNPVSAFTIFCLFARPFILKMQGASKWQPLSFAVESAFDWKASAREEWLRARIDEEGRAILYPSQGSGVMTSLSWADGLVMIPAGSGMKNGQSVRFYPFSEFLA